MLTKQEIREWQNLRVTKEFVESLKKDKQFILESWGRCDYTNDTVEGTIQLNSEALGKVQAIEDVLLAIEDFDQGGEDA